jgi:CSLREA domain-containing protein
MSFHFRRSTLLFILCLLLLVSLTHTSQVHAASIVVDSLEDTIAVDKACTLREAIQNATANKQTNADCAAGDDVDTITFSVKGTITLTKTLPQIFGRTGLTIDGGNNIVISGNKKVSIFVVNKLALFTLQNITVQDGITTGAFSGGMTIDGGTVNVINSTFAKNKSTQTRAAAIYLNTGTLNIENSQFADNDASPLHWGAVGSRDANAVINVNHSTFSNNIDGAMNTKGPVNVENSTFVESSITVTGPTTITNSTMVSTSDWIPLFAYGPTTVTNSTLVGKSLPDFLGIGAVVDIYLGRATFRNSIVANINTLGNNCKNDGGILNSNGPEFNLTDDDSCGKGFTKSTTINLAALTDNGGPTQTIGLLAGSAALGKGDPEFCPETDQRGEPRPKGEACTIGAFEGIVKENSVSSAATEAATTMP